MAQMIIYGGDAGSCNGIAAQIGRQEAVKSQYVPLHF